MWYFKSWTGECDDKQQSSFHSYGYSEKCQNVLKPTDTFFIGNDFHSEKSQMALKQLAL